MKWDILDVERRHRGSNAVPSRGGGVGEIPSPSADALPVPHAQKPKAPDIRSFLCWPRAIILHIYLSYLSAYLQTDTPPLFVRRDVGETVRVWFHLV